MFLYPTSYMLVRYNYIIYIFLNPDQPVIDLTAEDADLQRAIRLSMECSSPGLNNHR